MTRIAARKKTTGPVNKKLRVIAASSAGVIGAIIMLFLFVKYSHFDTWLSGSKTLVQNWFHTSKPINNNVNHIKQKQLAQNNDDFSEPIHFEFYAALPAAQVKNPATLAALQTKTAKEPPQNIASSQTVDSPASIGFKPEEIAQEFSKELNVRRYVLQLGIFSNADAAENYRKTLIKAGIAAAVVKDKQGRNSNYRLQQGPYRDLAQAKAIQKKLQARGIKSIVRKLA